MGQANVGEQLDYAIATLAAGSFRKAQRQFDVVAEVMVGTRLKD